MSAPAVEAGPACEVASPARAPLPARVFDLGLGRLRVLGTPRRQVGLAGYGLEVVEYVTL